jgi:hypothetical protein
MIRRRESYRAVKPIGGPIPDDAHHDPPVRPPQPPPTPAGGPVPALDALTLLALWRRFRMRGDAANAARMLTELERLAERKPRAEGEHDEQYG